MIQIYNLIGESLRVCEGFCLSSLEPTENYFSWVVVRYGIGETLVKFDDTMKVKPWLA